MFVVPVLICESGCLLMAVVGTIPTELCDITGFSLDVSDTSIHCYTGCLTSSAISVIGSDAACPGDALSHFLIVVGILVGLIILGNILLRVKDKSWFPRCSFHGSTSVVG